MNTIPAEASPHVLDTEWVAFSGGELEGKRPRVLCESCREKLNRTPHAVPRTSHPLCFACYRASLERERALAAAGELDTASNERFQGALPLEPVDRARLERLKLERGAARMASQSGRGRFVDKRRHAQIAARHALQRLADGLRARSAAEPRQATSAALHAAELQLPESWLPFVASR